MSYDHTPQQHNRTTPSSARRRRRVNGFAANRSLPINAAATNATNAWFQQLEPRTLLSATFMPGAESQSQAPVVMANQSVDAGEVDVLTVCVDDLTLVTDVANAKTVSLPIRIAAPEGEVVQGIASYQIVLRVFPTNAGISLQGGAYPAGSVIDEGSPQVFETGQRMVISNFITSPLNTAVAEDGQILLEALVDIAPNTEGDFTIDIEFVSLVDLQGESIVAAETVSGSISLSKVNVAPTAEADQYVVAENGMISVTPDVGVLANDIDLNGDDITAVLVDPPTHGQLTLNDNGGFVYTPTVGYTGDDSFTYVATDGLLETQPTTVSLNVVDLPELSVDDITVAEGDTGVTQATFTVTLSQSSAQLVAVAWALHDSTAIAGEDYTDASGNLTFTPGQTTKTITVDIATDFLLEGDETLELRLTNAVNAVIEDGVGQATIENDDVAQPTVTMTASDSSIAEPDDDAEITFTRQGNPTGDITVHYAIAGTAQPGADYETLTGEIMIPAGQTSVTLPIAVINDDLIEDDKTISLTLVADDSYVIGDDQPIELTLENDDLAPAVAPDLVPAVDMIKIKKRDDLTLVAGDKAIVKVLVDNIGNEKANERVDIVLVAQSLDGQTTVELARMDQKKLKIKDGKSKKCTFKFDVTTALLAGSYHLAVIVDESNVVIERSDQNNTTVDAATIVVQQADADIDAGVKKVKLKKNDFTQGNKGKVIATLAGAGNVDAKGDFHIDVFAVNGAGDEILLGQADKSTKVKLGKSKNQNVKIEIPDDLAAGDYAIVVDVTFTPETGLAGDLNDNNDRAVEGGYTLVPVA